MKVVYCAYGAHKYVDQLAQSVRSVKAHHPEARVIVHTTRDFAPYLSALPVAVMTQDVVARPGDWHDPMMKLRAILAEAEQGDPFLYLDSDTFVAGPLSDAWGMLDRFDCMGVQSPIHDQRGFLGLPPAPWPDRPPSEAFAEWNGGVLFLAGTDAASRLVRRWSEVQSRGIAGGGDQWPLAQALWDSDARAHTLPVNFNCRLPGNPTVYGHIRILHADHPDLAGIARRVNAQTGIRGIITTPDGYDARPLDQDGRRMF